MGAAFGRTLPLPADLSPSASRSHCYFISVGRAVELNCASCSAFFNSNIGTPYLAHSRNGFRKHSSWSWQPAMEERGFACEKVEPRFLAGSEVPMLYFMSVPPFALGCDPSPVVSLTPVRAEALIFG